MDWRWALRLGGAGLLAVAGLLMILGRGQDIPRSRVRWFGREPGPPEPGLTLIGVFLLVMSGLMVASFVLSH